MRAFRTLAVAGVGALLFAPAVKADEVSDLKAQINAMRQQMEMMEKRLETVTNKVDHPAPGALPGVAPAAGTPAVAENGKHGFLERKPGPALTFYTPGGELTAYGNFDVSFDVTDKGLRGLTAPGTDSVTPVGRVGALPAISSNSSYLGLRGFETLGSLPANFVWQLETGLAFSTVSGTPESNSNQSNRVNGGLTTRNTYIGLASGEWGAIKVGKTTAPYNNSTSALNPFAGKLGSASVVMGNTGGDNRVEFGSRLEHSVWYESPNLGGFRFNVLYSPGQNRASNSDNIAQGSGDCTGGNVPGSGATFTDFNLNGHFVQNFDCSDGSFSDAVSASLSYTRGPFYITAAYERHFKVNRASDIATALGPVTGLPGFTAGVGGGPDTIAPGSDAATSLRYQAEDIADEDAAKIGVQYILPTRTTISGIVEDLHRYVTSELMFQNERQRFGTWLAISQQITDRDSVHVGWAHAFRTPGDPGQHNDAVNPVPGAADQIATAGSGANNQANMYTFLYVHQFTPSLSVYFNYAATVNGPAAHYDLGAGGHGVTTDCHDAFGAAGATTAVLPSGPHCWTGATLMGASVGMDWKF